LTKEEKNLLEDQFQLNIFPDYVEAIIKGEDKGNAIKVILGVIGIDRKNSIALGDNINDIDMLHYAGLGVAMGNAVPELKAIAGFVTKKCGEGGAAEMLRRYVL
jgi:hydroxymethylpyrimidine pyrophosphatase-like HAD family hydrolase